MKSNTDSRNSSMDAMLNDSLDLVVSSPVSGGYEYLQKVDADGITQPRIETPFIQSDSPLCGCGAAQKLSEVIKVNHYWQKDYTSLMDDYNQLKARLWATESQLKNIERENLLLHQKLEDERGNTNEQTNIQNMAGVTESQTFTSDDVEALKQQLLVYKEDFEQEKEDNRKLTSDHNQMKLELQKAYSIIDKLTLKNNTIKENYRRVSTEKEHIIRELRKLSTSSNALPFSPVNPDYRLPRSGSEETLNSEDVIAHSARRTSPRVFYGGHVERDGLTLTLEKQKRDQYNR